jgi:predicted O-methyltransferase YrrM
VDLVFLDADKEGYADYLKQLLLLLRCGGTVIAHNIEPGEGRRRPGEARTATRASG